MNKPLLADLQWLAEQDPPPGSFPTPLTKPPASTPEPKNGGGGKVPKTPEEKRQEVIIKVISDVQEWAINAQKEALEAASHLVETYNDLDSTQLRASRRIVDKLTEASKAIDEVSQEAQDAVRHIEQPM